VNCGIAGPDPEKENAGGLLVNVHLGDLAHGAIWIIQIIQAHFFRTVACCNEIAHLGLLVN
jgi:hypothetical protein